MVDEAEDVDYQKLLEEGPALFTAELPDGTLADGGSTHEMAQDYISSKVATFEGDTVDEYVKLFVARVEQARRQELADRKTTARKEAAAQRDENDGLPDEALFG
jgi:hypothetical protein